MHLDLEDRPRIIGIGTAELYDLDGHLLDSTVFRNLVTQYGDQWYGEIPWGLGSNAAATGMQLGTGTTAVSKTGPGAAIGTYLAGSSVGFTSTWPRTSLNGSSRQIEARTEWGPGVATNGALTEVAIINQALAADAAAPAGATIARAKFATSLNKVALSVLVVTWRHLLLGA